MNETTRTIMGDIEPDSFYLLTDSHTIGILFILIVIIALIVLIIKTRAYYIDKRIYNNYTKKKQSQDKSSNEDRTKHVESRGEESRTVPVEFKKDLHDALFWTLLSVLPLAEYAALILYCITNPFYASEGDPELAIFIILIIVAIGLFAAPFTLKIRKKEDLANIFLVISIAVAVVATAAFFVSYILSIM